MKAVPFGAEFPVFSHELCDPDAKPKFEPLSECPAKIDVAFLSVAFSSFVLLGEMEIAKIPMSFSSVLHWVEEGVSKT